MSEGAMYVYAIGHDVGPQKIGISNHPPTRARALKVAGQPHYTVHAAIVVRAEHARRIEKMAHCLLRHVALGYERFAVTPAEAEAAIVEAIFWHAEERGDPSDYDGEDPMAAFIRNAVEEMRADDQPFV
ncbi:GIY-YIG nuclease family protein [Methylobacterium komagatae]